MNLFAQGLPRAQEGSSLHTLGEGSGQGSLGMGEGSRTLCDITGGRHSGMSVKEPETLWTR